VSKVQQQNGIQQSNAQIWNLRSRTVGLLQVVELDNKFKCSLGMHLGSWKEINFVAFMKDTINVMLSSAFAQMAENMTKMTREFIIFLKSNF